MQSAGGSCQNGNTGNDPIDYDEIVSECECECVRPFLAIHTTLKALRWVCWGVRLCLQRLLSDGIEDGQKAGRWFGRWFASASSGSGV
jgi:hypothetical protein